MTTATFDISRGALLLVLMVEVSAADDERIIGNNILLFVNVQTIEFKCTPPPQLHNCSYVSKSPAVMASALA